MIKFLDTTGLTYFWEKVETFLNEKVPITRKINGKALSDDITIGAEDVAYDNTTSGLSATDIKAAIDELATEGSGEVPDGCVYVGDDGEETGELVPVDADTLEGHASDYFATADHTHTEYLATDGTAVKATADANGNVIADTYASKDDLDGYFPLTGGTVDGDVCINSDEAVARLLRLNNAARKIDLVINAAGSLQLRDKTNGANIIESQLDGTNTFNGTATNADTLDGHDSDYFATAESVDNIQTTSKASLSTAGWYRVAEYAGGEAALKGVYANPCYVAIKKTYNTKGTEEYYLRLRSAYESQEFVCMDAKTHGAQTVSKVRYTYDNEKAYVEIYYNVNDSNPVFVEITNPQDFYKAWKAITPTLTEETVDGVTVTTTYDIPTNASPFTTVGGDINGNVTAKATDTSVRYVSAKNSVNDITLYANSNGDAGIRSETLSKWLAFMDANGNGYVNGTASENLPLDVGSGRAITGSGTVPLTVKTTISGGVFMSYADSTGVLGYLGFGSKNTPIFGDGDNRYSLHHDGNSAKVAISESAPSDTTALWVY